MNLKEAVKELEKIKDDFSSIIENMEYCLQQQQIDGYQIKIDALEAGIDALHSIAFLSKK